MLKILIKKNIILIIFLIIFIFINAFLILSLPEQMNYILTNTMTSKNNLIINHSIKMIIITFLIIISSLIMNYFSARISAQIASQIREVLFQKVIALPEKDFQKYSISSLITRSTSDIAQIQNTFNIGFKNLIFALVIAPFGIIKITQLTTNTLLNFSIIISIFLIIIFLVVLLLIVTPQVLKLQKLLEQLNLRTRETLNGLLTIKTFNGEKFEIKKYQSINKNYSNLDFHINKLMSLLNPYTTLIINIITIVITWSLLKSSKSQTELSLILTTSQYTIQIISAFLTLIILFILFPKAKVSYQRINDILNIPLKHNKTKIIKHVDNYQVINMSFTYPENQKPALKNISINIPLNKKIAIVGPSGSGKSTLLKILANTYPNYQGSITINNYELNNLSQQTTNKIISIIPAKSYIFQGTIKSNIKIANSQINNKEIHQLMNVFQLSEFNDLNYHIEQQGQNLSGGQKQRLALVRGFAKYANIYLVDDMFNGLDNITIKKILNNIDILLKNKTLIIASSLIKPIKNFDLIILMNNGKIEAIGQHQELLKIPIYKDLYENEVQYENI